MCSLDISGILWWAILVVQNFWGQARIDMRWLEVSHWAHQWGPNFVFEILCSYLWFELVWNTTHHVFWPLCYFWSSSFLLSWIQLTYAFFTLRVWLGSKQKWWFLFVLAVDRILIGLIQLQSYSFPEWQIISIRNSLIIIGMHLRTPNFPFHFEHFIFIC